MGYRSEVYMAIDALDSDSTLEGEFAGPAEAQFFRFKAMADAAGLTPTTEEWGGDDEQGIGWTATSFDFRALSVKWYPSFPEIQKMEAFFNLAKQMNNDGTAYLTGSFVRIGEENADIETDDFGDAPPDVYVVSSVQVDRDLDVFGKEYVAPETKQTEEV